MKFLVPNYSCLQNPWPGGYHHQIPVLPVLCPKLNLLNPPPPNKTPEYATGRGKQFLFSPGHSGRLWDLFTSCVLLAHSLSQHYNAGQIFCLIHSLLLEMLSVAKHCSVTHKQQYAISMLNTVTERTRVLPLHSAHLHLHVFCAADLNNGLAVMVTLIGASRGGTGCPLHNGRGQLKCDGTRAETRFHLSCETDESI